MKMNTQRLLFSLVMMAMFAACSRPVAYFQPSTRAYFATAPAKPKAVAVVDASVQAVAEVPVPAIAVTSVEQVAQANGALDQIDAMVRNDSKLATDKTVQKRLNRVRTFLTETSAKATATPVVNSASKKMNLMERLMVKKLNKKISKQLAPANPEKAMAVKGILVLGAVVLLVGILLLALTTGTGATIGVVGIIAGLILLLLGLL